MVMRKTREKWDPIDSIGEVGVAVAENIRRVRQDRGLAYTELAESLLGAGREIATLGLRKIESGGRRVDVDDLIALAKVLDVEPLELLGLAGVGRSPSASSVRKLRDAAQVVLDQLGR